MKPRIFFSLAALSLAATGSALADLPIQSVVLSGTPVPFLTDESLWFLNTASGSPNPGKVAFQAFLTGTGVTGDNDIADYFWDQGNLDIVARESYSPHLTAANPRITLLQSPSINAAGTTVFGGAIEAAQPFFGFYRRSSGGLVETLAETGDEVGTGLSLWVGSNRFGNRFPTDTQGRAYFIADLTGSNVDNSNLYAIFRASPGSIEMLARRGVTTVPGIPDPSNNIRFSLFSYLNANQSGAVAFHASVTNAPLNADEGIWTDASGTLSLVVRENDLAPGIKFARFFAFNDAVGLGDDGTVGFSVRLSGMDITSSNELSVWKGKPGALKLLAREGNQAPGLPPGVVFHSFGALGETGVAINPYGHAAFGATLRGTGITNLNDDSLWAEDGNGVLRLVVREGSQLPREGSNIAAAGGSNPDFPPFTIHAVGGFASATQLVFTSYTSSSSSESGVYAAEIPDETTPPVVRILGAKIRNTQRKTLPIRGTASDNLGLDRVEVKVGASPYRRAIGTVSWRITARLKPRITRVIVRAVDRAGNRSRPAFVTVRRQ